MVDHQNVAQSFEIRVAGDQPGSIASRRCVNDRISHCQPLSQRDVCSLKGQGIVQRDHFCSSQRGNRLNGDFFSKVAPDDFVDLVDLDRADYERIFAFKIGSEFVGGGSIRQVLDPAARVDQNQIRSSFSLSPTAFAPLAKPRYERMGACGTKKITPPFSRTVNFVPGRSWRCSRAAFGMTNWYLLERVAVSMILLKGYLPAKRKSKPFFLSAMPIS